MPVSLSDQRGGISFWFDCYKSDWLTTDWSTHWLFGWLRRSVGLKVLGRATGQATKGTVSKIMFFFSRIWANKQPKSVRFRKNFKAADKSLIQYFKNSCDVNKGICSCISMHVFVYLYLCVTIRSSTGGWGQSVCLLNTVKSRECFVYFRKLM